MTIEEMKLLTDILTAIQGINERLEGRRVFQEYKVNKTKRRAVERELEIIGEAVNNLLKINPTIPILIPVLLLVFATELSMLMIM
jgi:uncharacterized protein with HEPN domain